MAFSDPKAPRYRDMFLAIVVLIVALFALINLGVVVKLIGAGFMVIPSALGIVHQVGAQEVFKYDLRQSPTTVGISQPGRYALYAYDYDLLAVSDQLQESDAPPWITLKSEVTGESVPVEFVKRGLRPYDTFLAKGRPVLSFVITRPGIYVMQHPARAAWVALVRDYVTGKERTLTLLILAQIGVLAIVLGGPLLRRYLVRREARKQSQQEARRRAEDFWQRQERDTETWRRPQ